MHHRKKSDELSSDCRNKYVINNVIDELFLIGIVLYKIPFSLFDIMNPNANALFFYSNYSMLLSLINFLLAAS